MKQLIFVLFFSTIFFSTTTSFGESEELSILEEAIKKLEEQKFDMALELFDKILEIDPENIVALNNKANIIMESGNNEVALELFDKILEIDPEHIQTLNNKGILLSTEGNAIEGLKLIFDAYYLDPYNTITIDNIKKLEKFTPFFRETGFGKVIVKDKNGNLVGFTESIRINVHHPLGIKYLEEKCTLKENVIVNDFGRDFECTDHFVVDEYALYSKTVSFLYGPTTDFKVVTLEHDSFFVEPNDIIEIKLNIFNVTSYD